MKGHERIIAMRKTGRMPSVGVNVSQSSICPWFDWLETKVPGVMTVWIEPSDKPEKLDLRFLVGLHVCVTADGDVSQDLVDACVKAKAARVVKTANEEGRLVVLWDSEEEHADHR